MPKSSNIKINDKDLWYNLYRRKAVIFLEKSNKKSVVILDGIDSTANVLSLIHPVLAGITIITYVIKQIIGYASSDDIVKRINKIEKELNNKKIDMEEFKSKILELSEHNVYVARNNLNNILLTCIPETVDLYISLWIDLIMNEENSAYEELCEILNSLNKNDLLLLKKIKKFMKYGEKRFYITSEIANRKRADEEEKKNAEIREYNAKTTGIKKLEVRYSDRDVRIGDKTIFWKDFSKYYNVNVNEMGYMILAKGINEKKQLTMDWAYYVRSFIKLDSLGILQLDYYTTVGTVNSLNIDRFHITLFGEQLLEYVPLERNIHQ